MRIVFFVHSVESCWNNGNAHFLRGVLRALGRRGHDVVAHEPADGWSRTNLLAAHGTAPLEAFRRRFPDLSVETYAGLPDLDRALHGADVVVVHEWTDPALVAAIGRRRAAGGRFVLLFHDTHHRAVSDPGAMGDLDLSAFDGVLAFGASLAEVWRRRGWGERAFVWHEAADVSTFRPPAPPVPKRRGLVWIGNWGDGERSRELEELLFAPAARAGETLRVHGVRYPDEALHALARHGASWRGWVANADAPDVFARHVATVHVPRLQYARLLPGIPTIRVFEALACGIPLVSTVWRDVEGLFTPGFDYLVGDTGNEVEAHLAKLAGDPDLSAALAANGLETIRRRHTCDHRAEELVSIVGRIREGRTAPAAIGDRLLRETAA